MSEFRFREIIGWLLAIVLGFGIGFAAIAGHAWWQQRSVRAQMIQPGEFAALLASVHETNALMVVRAGCRYCEMGRQWLDQRKIRVTEVAIGVNPQVDRVLERLHVPGTPVVLFKDLYIVGFDAAVWALAFEDADGSPGRR